MLQRFLILWLTALCGLAHQWPRLQALWPWLPDPFQATSASVITALIFVTMFAVGMMLPRDEVREVAQRWPAVLYGTALQYTTMPLLAFLAGRVGGLSADDAIGIAIVGCVPGAMASNVVTLNARGHTSYSVSLTTASTLLSPLAVPLLLRWSLSTDQRAAIPWGATSLNLLLTVVLPVVAGHGVSRRWPHLESKINRIGATAANLTILWIIASVVGKTRTQFSGPPANLILALLFVNIVGYVAGYAGGYLARLPESMRRALSIEIGMQNAGLGVKLATDLFSSPAVAVAPALYTFGCMLTGTMLAAYWARRRLGA
jgi:BASS family bile acid:Na+ symporter